MVENLINQESKCWNDDLLTNIFSSHKVEVIKCIPLSRATVEDRVVWSGDSTGDYTVWGGYRMLTRQQNTDAIASKMSDIYKKIWQQQIPSKIRITSWHEVKNYIPTTYELYNRRIALTPLCLRCDLSLETSLHALLWCGPAQEVWYELGFTWSADITGEVYGASLVQIPNRTMGIPLVDSWLPFGAFGMLATSLLWKEKKQ